MLEQSLRRFNPLLVTSEQEMSTDSKDCPWEATTSIQASVTPGYSPRQISCYKKMSQVRSCSVYQGTSVSLILGYAGPNKAVTVDITISGPGIAADTKAWSIGTLIIHPYIQIPQERQSYITLSHSLNFQTMVQNSLQLKFNQNGVPNKNRIITCRSQSRKAPSDASVRPPHSTSSLNICWLRSLGSREKSE